MIKLLCESHSDALHLTIFSLTQNYKSVILIMILANPTASVAMPGTGRVEPPILTVRDIVNVTEMEEDEEID